MKCPNKLSRKRSAMPSSDRISSLPDPILCPILSYLPIKLAAATSIVAKRWRFLWNRVENIDFYSSYNSVEFGEDADLSQMRLSEIVNRVLLLHDGPRIDTFSLPLMECSKYELETWISTSIARHVKVLNLYLNEHCRLPHCLFKSKTLVDLTLHMGICSLVPGAVCLPNLIKLHLHDIQYESEESITNLISGCLVLEDLLIEGKIFTHDNMFCCNISSQTLKRLTLSFTGRYQVRNELSHSYLEELTIPTLQYLILKDNSRARFSVRTLSSLVEADIHLYKNGYNIDIPYSRSLFELVESVSKVKSLTLSSPNVLRLDDASFSVATTKFHNLTKLDLEADWRLVSRFLEIADNLQDLIIRHLRSGNICSRKPQHVPACLLSSLRTVKVYGFQCDHRVIKMVSYILKNAKFLKRMEIFSEDGDIYSMSKFNMLQKISLCKRGSKTRRVSFV